MSSPRTVPPPPSGRDRGRLKLVLLLVGFIALAVMFGLVVKPFRRDAIFGAPRDTPAVVKP